MRIKYRHFQRTKGKELSMASHLVYVIWLQSRNGWNREQITQVHFRGSGISTRSEGLQGGNKKEGGHLGGKGGWCEWVTNEDVTLDSELLVDKVSYEGMGGRGLI